MKIVVDIKNIALFNGGISSLIKPLLFNWIEQENKLQFILLGPPIETTIFNDFPNVEFEIINWPKKLPKKIRHPFYDTVLFPNAIRKLKPDFIFTPYHDVLLPKGIPSIMMIHDTCIGDLKDFYPKALRIYYEIMLKLNLERCTHVLTVSNSSKTAIIKRYVLEESMISVIPNSFSTDSNLKLINVYEQAQENNRITIFYPGGVDFRKNVKRLVLSLNHLKSKGYNVLLRVTGNYEGGWERELKGIEVSLISTIKFLGYLNPFDLHNEYINADVVVYPTLCEGFGRVCLEAMGFGAKLACSDIPVLHEVADDYAVFFNPFNPADIAKKIIIAHKQEIKTAIIKSEYDEENVSKLFVKTMKKYLVF